MHYLYDENFKGITCDCSNAEECLQMIIDIGFDYDNMDTSVESMRELVDELCDYARKGIKFLIDKKYTKEDTEEEDMKSREIALEHKRFCNEQ